jgi:hypothetical protein
MRTVSQVRTKRKEAEQNEPKEDDSKWDGRYSGHL